MAVKHCQRIKESIQFPAIVLEVCASTGQYPTHDFISDAPGIVSQLLVRNQISPCLASCQNLQSTLPFLCSFLVLTMNELLFHRENVMETSRKKFSQSIEVVRLEIVEVWKQLSYKHKEKLCARLILAANFAQVFRAITSSHTCRYYKCANLIGSSWLWLRYTCV